MPLRFKMTILVLWFVMSPTRTTHTLNTPKVSRIIILVFSYPVAFYIVVFFPVRLTPPYTICPFILLLICKVSASWVCCFHSLIVSIHITKNIFMSVLAKILKQLKDNINI